MRASAASTRYAPAASLSWRISEFTLPAKPPAPATDYRSSLSAAFAHRKTPLAAALLEIGPAAILHLPGEPMLEFQNYARGLRPGRFTAVAGYGDISPGYLCTDQAHAEGGYEPSASHAGPGTEARVKKAIQELMR